MRPGHGSGPGFSRSRRHGSPNVPQRSRLSGGNRNLTPPYPRVPLPAVRRLRSLFAFVLLALWLPATLHCDLEAAGVELIPESSACEDQCVKDTCPTVEGISYTKETTLLKVLPPLVPTACLCLLDLSPPLLTEQNSTGKCGETPPAVEVLDHTWPFARRAALPARAPADIA